MQESKHQDQIIIIGAGPIGLFTAIQIKLYRPTSNIVIYEKYKEYQRKHAIHVSSKSFSGSHQDKEFQKLLTSLSGNVRTSAMEDTLKNFALALGIHIKYENVTDVRDLAEKDCKYLIGADGAHSIVHSQIFHGKYQINYNFRNIMEIKYDVFGPTKKLSICSSLSCGSRHLVHQFVGKPRSDSKTTPVVLRFLITEDEYKDLQSASFKHPWNIEDKRIPDEVKTSIDSWLLARKEGLEEKIVPNSTRLSVVSLPTYASAQFYKKNKDTTTFLVGDAACGVPYFRSINNGLLCASVLAKNLDSPDVYANFVQSRVARELLGAKIKDKVITSMDYSHSGLVATSDFVKSKEHNLDYDLEESTTYSFVSICSIL